MTAGHKHRHVKIRQGSRLHAFLTKPRYYSVDMAQIMASPYPYGPVYPERGYGCPVWYLSILSVLHRWTGLTIEAKP